jgi:hypothetical protein
MAALQAYSSRGVSVPLKTPFNFRPVLLAFSPPCSGSHHAPVPPATQIHFTKSSANYYSSPPSNFLHAHDHAHDLVHELVHEHDHVAPNGAHLNQEKVENATRRVFAAQLFNFLLSISRIYEIQFIVILLVVTE